MTTPPDTPAVPGVGRVSGQGARPRRRVGASLVLVLAVVLLVAAASVVWWLTRGPSGRYAEATRTLPDSTLRSSFTDWAAVGEEIDLPGLEESKDPDQVRRFLDRAYDLDLSTGSTQLDVVGALATIYGYSLADVDWEIYGQSRDGSVSVLRLDDSADFDAIAADLERAGYEEPEDEDGVWRGNADLVSQFEPPMGTQQHNVLLLSDEQLVLTSDAAAYLEQVRETVRGDADSMTAVPGVEELIEASDDSPSAQLWARDFACEDLTMSQADRADQDEAARLIEAAGGVTPLDGLLLARGLGDRARIAMWFDSAEDADHDLQPRTDLAQGPAPGQGGDFTERFTLTGSRVDGQLVTMDLRSETGTLLSDLGQGPVLLATC